MNQAILEHGPSPANRQVKCVYDDHRDSSQQSDEQVVTGRHDEHFLRRVERLPARQVDLALGLYRDHELVKLLLNDLELTTGAERVAISLNEPVTGPFIVVARDGHFVTCLGEGMRVADIPVVTKAQFDAVARRVQGYRDMSAEIAKHPQQEVSRILRRILRCGSDISREEFQAVAAWQPLLAPTLIEVLLKIREDLVDTYEILSRRRGTFKPKDEPALQRYWQDAWTIAHMTMLLGVDGGEYLRSLCAVPGLQPLMSRLTWQTTGLNVRSHGLRGAWLAAQIGEPLLPLITKVYTDPDTQLHLLDAGIVLCAIGHAHRQLRSEVDKLLAQASPLEGPPLSIDCILRYSFSTKYACGVQDPTLARRCHSWLLGLNFCSVQRE